MCVCVLYTYIREEARWDLFAEHSIPVDIREIFQVLELRETGNPLLSIYTQQLTTDETCFLLESMFHKVLDHVYLLIDTKTNAINKWIKDDYGVINELMLPFVREIWSLKTRPQGNRGALCGKFAGSHWLVCSRAWCTASKKRTQGEINHDASLAADRKFR